MGVGFTYLLLGGFNFSLQVCHVGVVISIGVGVSFVRSVVVKKEDTLATLFTLRQSTISLYR
jgi:hypothetical protein